jgi:hypothetical protein
VTGAGNAHPSVTVVIPTRGGRARSLKRALGTLLADPSTTEVIVVFDAASVPADAPRDVKVSACGPTGHWGAEQRNFGISRATGTHIAFIDDDDVYTPGAAGSVARALAARPGRVHIFQMRDGDRLYGGYGCLFDGGIGTPMFVVPNDGATGAWTARYQGDFDFIVSTLARRRRRPRFHQDVVAEIRPHEAGPCRS